MVITNLQEEIIRSLVTKKKNKKQRTQERRIQDKENKAIERNQTRRQA